MATKQKATGQGGFQQDQSDDETGRIVDGHYTKNDPTGQPTAQGITDKERLADLDRQMSQTDSDDRWVSLFLDEWLPLHAKVYGYGRAGDG